MFVYDEDAAKQDDFLGYISLPVSPLIEQTGPSSTNNNINVNDDWFNLATVPGMALSRGATGALHLRIHYLPDGYNISTSTVNSQTTTTGYPHLYQQQQLQPTNNIYSNSSPYIQQQQQQQLLPPSASTFSSSNNTATSVSGFAGKIKVTVVEAKNLRAADKTGTSDPYCILKVGEDIQETTVIKRTLVPKWREQFKLYVIFVYYLSIYSN